MFDIDAILKTKQDEVAKVEEVRRPIKALYKLIVDESSVCKQDLRKYGLTIGFKTKGFDENERFTFSAYLYETAPHSYPMAGGEISLVMHKLSYEVCFHKPYGVGTIVLHGTAETALAEILKYLSTTMTPAIGNHIEKQLLKEQSQ